MQYQTYSQIAQENGYSYGYFAQIVGPRLCQRLSQLIGCRVNKKNFQALVKSYAAAQLAQLTISELRVDYNHLRDLLAAGKWKEADRETSRVMHTAAERAKEGWIGIKDINKIPCEVLRTIDQLWVQYSNGRFGFSVQKQIYQSLGSTRKFDAKIWQAFGERLGWRVKGDWLYPDDLTFDIKAQQGHLP